MTTLPVSADYRSAIKVAIVLQVVLTLLLLPLVDDDDLYKTSACAMAGFWVGTAIVMLRRPRLPGRIDLLYVRWGYIPMLVVGMSLSPLMGVLRGHH